MKKTELYVQTEKFEQINGNKCEVVIKHALWGVQMITCDRLELVNDDQRLGVSIDGHDLYVYKPEMILCSINDNVYIVADKTVQIEIYVNKL
mgnify:CR=1 FL=1